MRVTGIRAPKGLLGCGCCQLRVWQEPGFQVPRLCSRCTDSVGGGAGVRGNTAGGGRQCPVGWLLFKYQGHSGCWYHCVGGGWSHVCLCHSYWVCWGCGLGSWGVGFLCSVAFCVPIHPPSGGLMCGSLQCPGVLSYKCPTRCSRLKGRDKGASHVAMMPISLSSLFSIHSPQLPSPLCCPMFHSILMSPFSLCFKNTSHLVSIRMIT